MSIEATTLAALTGSATITALCPATSIYFGTAPQDPNNPFIFATTISTSPVNTFDQGATGATRLDNTTLQITAYQRTLAQANALANAIRTVLEAQRPVRYHMVNRMTDYDDFPDLHGTILTFSVWHS